MLYKLPQRCEKCSEYNMPPFLFRKSITKDNIIFNRELAIETIWIYKKPLLQILYTETRFQNSIAIKDK